MLFLISYYGYGQCILNVALNQQSVNICAGNSATLTANGGTSYAWFDAANGGNQVSTNQSFSTPVLNSSVTYYVEVSANGCTSPRLPVAVNVNPIPQPPTANGATICAGSSANLHASGTASIYNWYLNATGGTPLISSPDFTTPALNATTTYFVDGFSNGCESGRTAVTVIVNPVPTTPIVPDVTTCYNSSATLTTTSNPSGTYQWFDAISGGNLLATGTSFTTPALTNSATFYIQATNGQCSSGRASVNVKVQPQLPPPTVAGALICQGSSAVLTATSQGGGTYQWFDAATGGNQLATGSNYSTPVLNSSTTYYVQNTIGNCVSARAAVTVITLTPTSPPTSNGTSVCAGGIATLTASSGSNNYAWYDSANGGNLLSTAKIFTTPVLTNTTTYYVETTANGCTSPRTPVTVTVNAIPLAPTSSNVTTCPGTTATLTATGTGTINWFDAATNGNLVATGNTFVTPVLNTNTTYYAQTVTGQCASALTPVSVTVTQLNYPQFQYPSGTYCTSSTNAIPTINNPSGGTFTASPTGLVFVDNTTGEINISASTPGNYVLTFTNNAPCPVTSTAKISIVSVFKSQFSYSGPYCQDNPNPSPTFSPGASGGVFTTSSAGLVLVDPNSGQINLGASSPGTYSVTNTILSSAGCPQSVSTSSVTIFQQVIVDAGPAQTVKPGSIVQLAGSISGAVTTGKWTGGTGKFSNPASPTSTYTPGPGETSATLTLTSNSPPGPCGPKSGSVTIIVDATFAAPTATGTTVCNGSSAVLTATAPGGFYQWFDAATGGNLLITGGTFTTPALIATTTYFVEVTRNGLTSTRTPVTVTVSPPPPAPIVQSTLVCAGNSTTLTATGSSGTYEWYDAASAGNLLSTSNIYSTPVLVTNTSYYVQAIVNGCISSRTQVDLTVNQVPNITSAPTLNNCSGQEFVYNITADLPTATFVWSRATVTNISNAAVTNMASATIDETLINTTNTAVNVTYVITPYNGTCAGPSFNFTVTVYPTPVVTSPATTTICNYNLVGYAISFNTVGTGFSWSRAAVTGISNAPVSGQTSNVIREVLFNLTNKPINVNYSIVSATSTCPGIPFNLVVTVNPSAGITSPAVGYACNGVPQNYSITSTIPGTTYVWSRDSVANISNATVTNQTANSITEALVNTSTDPVLVTYNIRPTAFGCISNLFQYSVIVNPTILAPKVQVSPPVCVGSSINLSTPDIPNASYLWTGPNGFTSTLQNPVINNVTLADGGDYTLVVTINTCPSPPTTVKAVVDAPSIATAGPDQFVCKFVPFVALSGTVTGGSNTGVWSTAGTGSFSPSANALNAQYIPSAADVAAGSVVLTLSSISLANCNISTSNLTIKFGELTAVIAGQSQTQCAQTTAVQLDGKVLIPGGGLWSTSGTGTFSPSANALNAIYIPGATDGKSGSVTLTLTALGADHCYIPSDNLTINFTPPPIVNAGGKRYVLKGNTITLEPTVNESNVSYQWFPNIDISNDKIKNPVITGDIDRVYTLTVTDARGCISSDEVIISVSPQLVIPNTFTPNGDGINDYWDINGLIAFNEATVDIYTRYGQKIFHSLGYPKPWDGTYNGQQLPAGVYYYVIDTKVKGQLISGYITIIR